MKTKRRWFQFSLRTMLVVMVVSSAAFGYWVHWSRDWIRQRREVLDRQYAHDATWNTVRPRAPGGLWLLGEKGVSIIAITRWAPFETEERVRNLFPEAQVQLPPTAVGSMF